jgi:hypothetical protein
LRPYSSHTTAHAAGLSLQDRFRSKSSGSHRRENNTVEMKSADNVVSIDILYKTPSPIIHCVPVSGSVRDFVRRNVGINRCVAKEKKLRDKMQLDSPS